MLTAALPNRSAKVEMTEVFTEWLMKKVQYVHPIDCYPDILAFYPGMFFSNEDSTLTPLKIQAKPKNTMLSGRSQASKVEHYDPICMKCPNEANPTDRGGQQLPGAREEQNVAEPCSSRGGETSWNWNMVKTDLMKPPLSCSHRREGCMLGTTRLLRALIIKEGKQKRRHTGRSVSAGLVWLFLCL